MQDHPRRLEGRLGGRHGAEEHTRTRRTDERSHRGDSRDDRGDQNVAEVGDHFRHKDGKPRDIGEDRPESKSGVHHFIGVLKRKKKGGKRGTRPRRNPAPPKRKPSYKMHRIFASVGENVDATGRRSRHSRVRSSEIASWKISIRSSKIGRTLRHASLISSASADLLASRRAE